MSLGRLGIAGAVAGIIGLIVPALWTSSPAKPVATIDAPSRDGIAARCFVAKGRVVPSSIRRPLWLIKADAGDGWKEVGQIYPPPGTWGSRVCASDPATRTVRLALVLADEQLDATFSRIVPEPRKEAAEVIPEWLRRHADGDQQGGRGGRYREGFPALPVGASLVTSVDVHLAGGVDPFAYLAAKGPIEMRPRACEAPRSKKRHRRTGLPVCD